MSDAMNQAKRIAVVGSPSTNNELVIDVTSEATHDSLVGQLLAVEQPIATTSGTSVRELALGTITEVTTTNQFHANPSLLGVIREDGAIEGMTGDPGDTRAARVKLQSCFRYSDTKSQWVAAGAGLSTSPATGAGIKVVDNDVVAELVYSAAGRDLHAVGTLLGPAMRGEAITVPFALPDYTGTRGGFALGVFGNSGSGKSAMASYVLASMFRHTSMGFIVVDPQGQFGSETGLPFSVQGFAAEMGRAVQVRRIAEDLQLERSPGLFVSLLGKTKFARNIMKMSPETVELLMDEIERALRGIEDWDELDAQELLSQVLTVVSAPGPVGRVYAAQDRQDRLTAALVEIRDDQVRRAEVSTYFSVIHNLFTDHNPAGGKRYPLRGVLMGAFDSSASEGTGFAPYTVLDMSTRSTSWLEALTGDSERAEAQEALAILDADAIKAAILRQVFASLKSTSEQFFREGRNLNTMIVVDEAWRYAPPANSSSEPEINALSNDLAGYAKDFRKFGLGFLYILQAARGLHNDIFEQLLIRIIGYGLAGPDLEKIAEHLDDRDHLRLYRNFVPPDSLDPRVYPFMCVGPVSPLAVTRAPIMVAAFTDFDAFRAANFMWMHTIRTGMGKDTKTGLPEPLDASARNRFTVARGKAFSKSKAAKAAVVANAEHGGVDPKAGFALPGGDASIDPLAALDGDEEFPF